MATLEYIWSGLQIGDNLNNFSKATICKNENNISGLEYESVTLVKSF